MTLARARDLGFLGPGAVGDHLDHSAAFVAAWASVQREPPATVLDLGSGVGVPGLVLALTWPESRVILLDGSERRAAFLERAVLDLGLGARVRVTAQRAEEAGRSVLRGTQSLVTARGFGPPAVTAECGAALLDTGGILAVSEPPGGDPSRWPEGPLAAIGLEIVGTITDPAAVEVLRKAGPYPSRFPRRIGIPAKRPLWS